MWGQIVQAAGTTVNNRLQQVVDAYQFFKSIGDQQKMQKAIAQLRAMKDITPQQLQIAAQQMGQHPDVILGADRSSQRDALRRLQQITSADGLDPQSLAMFQQAQAKAGMQRQAGQQAIQQNLQARGLQAGSGAQLAMRQNAAQGAANSLAMAGTQAVADARQRALQGIAQSGRLAGDLASAEQQIALANRQAKMQRDRFNTGIRQASNVHNADARLRAAQFNLGLKQAKVDPSRGGTTRLRDEQTGYARDFGNRQQMQAQNLAAFGGGSFGGKGGKKSPF